MTTEASKLLAQMQTGEYLPNEDEKIRLKALTQRRATPMVTNGLGREDYMQIARDPMLNMENTALGEEAARAGWGQSRYDTGTFEPDMDLEDARARAQSGGAKILNGAIKGGIVAATTAVETVAGVVDGLLEGTGELARQALMGERLDMSKAVGKGVNNFTARTMADIQSLSEEWFPNYRTAYERTDKYQDEWWKHIGSANFIGDSFLKNFGFTVGALAGGAAWSKALSAGLKAMNASNLLKGVVAAAEGDAEAKAALENALKLVSEGKIASIADDPAVAKIIGGAAKNLNKLSAQHQLFGGVIAAMGEGTFEGVMARNEFLENNLKDIDREYEERYRNLETQLANDLRWDPDKVMMVPFEKGDGMVDYRPQRKEAAYGDLEKARNELAAEHQRAREYAMELGDRVAATTFVWNLPILTLSNTMQFGRMLSGGFNTSRKVAKTVGQIAKQDGKLVGQVAAKEAGKNALLGKTALYTLKNGATEAAEEMSQGFISSGAKHVADSRLTSFNDDGYDRRVLADLGEWANTMLEGGMDYLKQGRNWQEGFLGMMTGVIGIPGRHWQGGVAEAHRQAKSEIKGAQDAANALNSLVETERFQNALKGWVRHEKYDNEMGEAVVNDDQYTWRTASDKQLVNDIITFANAGRLKDLEDLVDYYASMPDDDSNGLNVVEAATGEHNQTENQNNPEKVVKNVKERANEIKEHIRMYSDMYDAMTTLAPMDASRDQIEEMIAASMNIKAFEKRFLTMFDDIIKFISPYIGPVRNPETGEPVEKEKLQHAQEVYDSIAQVFTNVEVPLNPNIIDDFKAFPALKELKGIIDKYGDDSIKQKYEDLKKVAMDRKAFVNKLLTLKGLSASEFRREATNADDVNQEMKREESQKEVEKLTSLKAVRDAFNADRKKTFGDSAEFLSRMRDLRNSNEHVSKFLDIYDTYSDIRSAFIKRGGNLSGIAKEMLDKLFDNAASKEDILDETKLQTYEQWQEGIHDEVAAAGTNFEAAMSAAGNRMDVDKATYDAVHAKMGEAIRAVRSDNEAAGSRKEQKNEPAPQPQEKKDVAQSESKEAPDPATKGPDPSAKKKAVLSEDGNTAVDAVGRTWHVGDKVYCYDGTKANPEPEEFTIMDFYTTKRGEVKATLTGPRQMKVSLVHQTPFLHKELPVPAEKKTETPAVPVTTPKAEEVVEEVVAMTDQDPNVERVEGGRNSYGQKLYFQTALPEFTSASIKAYREAKTPQAKRSALKKLVDFITPHKDDKVIQKLISEDAWTNMVKHVEVGDKVEFIGISGYVGKDGKPVIFMAVTKDGRRYIFNVVRRNGDGVKDYEGLQDFIDAFDYAYEHRTGNPNDEYVFPQTSTVWAKREGIIDYAIDEENFSGERPIVQMQDGHMQPGIEAYDENAPVIWINGDGNIETLRGDPKAARTIFSFVNMTQGERNRKRGNLYYLAEDGRGGYVPIRLGLEHFTPENMDRDTSDFAAVRRSLTAIQGIAGNFFHRMKGASTDEERNAIIEEENKRMHEEIGNNLKKYVNLAHGFFRLMVSKEGNPILMYDANPAIVEKRDSDHFEGFILGENNYDMLLKKFAEQRVSFDLRPTENLDEFLRKGYITSNARKLLPKETDVYMERFKDGKFVSTEDQKELIPKEDRKPIEEETKETTFEPAPVEGSLFEAAEEGADQGGGLTFVFEEGEEGEFGPAEKAPDFTPAKTPWQQLSDGQQKALISHYGPEIQDYFDDPSTSPEDRQDKLDCVGVD